MRGLLVGASVFGMLLVLLPAAIKLLGRYDPLPASRLETILDLHHQAGIWIKRC